MSFAISGAQGSGAIAGAGILSGIQSMSATTLTLGCELDYQRGISIRILPANGGTIISIKSEVDPGIASKTDLYVISEGQDLGAEIGKIITMHHLKK